MQGGAVVAGPADVAKAVVELAGPDGAGGTVCVPLGSTKGMHMLSVQAAVCVAR